MVFAWSTALGGLLVAGLLGQGAAPAALSSSMREIARGEQSNIESARRTAVRSTAEWTALWKEHDWDRPAPAVDFAREMAVAVFLGTQTSAGHGVRIRAVRTAAAEVIVEYQVTRPAPGNVAAQILTFPYHIVAVPRQAGAVRFQQVE